MKISSKIIVGGVVIFSFIIGFFIGISVDYPKTDNSKMSGTIGRMINYRNVKVSENDIKLRSELQSNGAMLKGYQQYFSFHYTTTAKLFEDIEFAIQTSESVSDFKNTYPKEIEEASNYKQNLEQARKDILLALTSLQNLSEANGNNIGLLINNANIAIAQVKYKQEDVTSFVEAIEAFLAANGTSDFADLKKAHDLLSMNQIILAAATNDKPMLKYLDKRAFISGSEQLQIVVDKEKLNGVIQSDLKSLNIFLSENKDLGIVFSSETIGNIEKQLGVIIPNMEKLGLIILNSEKLGIVVDKEKLGVGKNESLDCCIIIFNAEKLGAFLNAEKIGIYSNENLGVCNFEKLAAFNTERLNIE